MYDSFIFEKVITKVCSALRVTLYQRQSNTQLVLISIVSNPVIQWPETMVPNIQYFACIQPCCPCTRKTKQYKWEHRPVRLDAHPLRSFYLYFRSMQAGSMYFDSTVIPHFHFKRHILSSLRCAHWNDIQKVAHRSMQRPIYATYTARWATFTWLYSTVAIHWR